MVVAATVVMVVMAVMAAVAAVAPASFLAAAEAAAEDTGAGLTACGPGVLATITAISAANVRAGLFSRVGRKH